MSHNRGDYTPFFSACQIAFARDMGEATDVVWAALGLRRDPFCLPGYLAAHPLSP